MTPEEDNEAAKKTEIDSKPETSLPGVKQNNPLAGSKIEHAEKGPEEKLDELIKSKKFFVKIHKSSLLTRLGKVNLLRIKT